MWELSFLPQTSLTTVKLKSKADPGAGVVIHCFLGANIPLTQGQSTTLFPKGYLSATQANVLVKSLGQPVSPFEHILAFQASAPVYQRDQCFQN